MTRSGSTTHGIGPAEDLPRIDSLVLATVNAPYRRSISAAMLRQALASAEAGDWGVHLATFFTDVAPSLVFLFAKHHGISRARLARSYAVVRAATGEQNAELEKKLVPLASASR